MGERWRAWLGRLALGATVLAVASAAPINEGDVLLISNRLQAPPVRALSEADRLDQRLRALALQFPGDVGIAVRRLDADWTVSVNGDRDPAAAERQQALGIDGHPGGG